MKTKLTLLLINISLCIFICVRNYQLKHHDRPDVHIEAVVARGNMVLTNDNYNYWIKVQIWELDSTTPLTETFK